MRIKMVSESAQEPQLQLSLLILQIRQIESEW